MSWLEKILPRISTTQAKKTVPEGLWVKCPSCDEVLYSQELLANLNVCPKCEHHNRINARQRMGFLLDKGDTVEIGQNVKPLDTLKFKDTKKYTDRLSDATKATGQSDALMVKAGKIAGQDAVVAVFDFEFMGGSMGSVVGERFVRGVRHAVENHMAFVCVSASGGARMQEALFSLMQMAKTSAALTVLSQKKLPFISVLTDPTMGGVSASFAFLGDVVIAEPNALVGFAGPRVIEQTVREKLPEGFQRAEFLLEKGAVDMIVHRKLLANQIGQLISMLRGRSAASVFIEL